jgi:hypothetical protein
VPTCVARLLASGVLRHTHRIVLCAAFDCIVRHARLLPHMGAGSRTGLTIVLDALLGDAGMRCADARVRQRAVSAFARLARPLRT